MTALRAGWPGRVAVAIIRTDPPSVTVAESEEVLGRLLALHVVAQSDPADLAQAGKLDEIRTALLEERWADAVAGWIDSSDVPIDAYPDEMLWTDARVDAEAASFEIRLAPIFKDLQR